MVFSGSSWLAYSLSIDVPKLVALVGADIEALARGRGASEEEDVCESVDLGGSILDGVVAGGALREGDLGRKSDITGPRRTCI